MAFAHSDGKLVDRATLSLHPTDFGFARGIGLYELTRVYNGKPFRLDDHIARFLAGAASFDIVGLHAGEIAEATAQVITGNGFAQSTIRYYLTAGECQATGFGFGSFTGFTPHFMIIEDEVAYPHPAAPRGIDLHKRGIDVKTVPFSRDTPSVKSTNYSLSFRALRKGPAAGADDVLFVHQDGYITEGSTSNIFAVIDGRLVTPKRGMLGGITRKVLLELAPRCGIEAVERDILPGELSQATEAFMTGSYTEMMSIRSLDAHAYRLTTDGPVFGKLRAALTSLVKAL